MSRLSDALLARALRHHSDTVRHPGWLSGLRDPYVAAALTAMHDEPARSWTLAGLAAAAGLSRAAFAARCAICCRCGCSRPARCSATSDSR